MSLGFLFSSDDYDSTKIHIIKKKDKNMIMIIWISFSMLSVNG